MDLIDPEKPRKGRGSRKKAAGQAGIRTFVYHTRVRDSALALYWNAAAPLAFIIYWELEGTGWQNLAFVLPAVGLVLAAIALRRYIRYRTDGIAILFLEPLVPRLGVPFTARFEHARKPADGRLYTAHLQCTKWDYFGDESSSSIVWTQAFPMTTKGGIAVTALTAPRDQPHSHEATTSVSYKWSIDLDRGGYRQEFPFEIRP